MKNTLVAMKRLEEIRIKRAERFYDKRMDKAAEFKRQHKRREIEKHMGLVISKNALKNKDKLKEIALKLP
eukprot:UN03388